MPKKGHYQGKKFVGRHTSVIEKAEMLIKEAEKIAEVDGIQPSHIKGARSRCPRFSFKRVHHGLSIMVYGPATKQEIVLYTNNPEKVEADLKAVLPIKTSALV